MVNEKTMVANSKDKRASKSPIRDEIIHEQIIKSGKYKLKKETYSNPNERENPILDIKRV